MHYHIPTLAEWAMLASIPFVFGILVPLATNRYDEWRLKRQKEQLETKRFIDTLDELGYGDDPADAWDYPKKRK